MTADRIVEEAGIDLVVDKLAWVLRDRWRVLLAEAVVIIIPLLNDPGQPAAFVFDRDDFELWVPLDNARRLFFPCLCCSCGRSKCADSQAYRDPARPPKICRSGWNETGDPGEAPAR